jgi:glycosyltransferase involved in cell wall biosynthesis
MKLLFLTPQLPFPPRQGATLRNYALIRYLARQHTVDLLTLLAPNERLEADNPLHHLCRRVTAAPQPVRKTTQRFLDTMRTPLPDMALRLDTPAMHQLVQQWVATESYDIVQIEGIEMAPYGLQLLAHSRAASNSRKARLVFDNHNCEYLLQQRTALSDLRHPLRWPAAVYSLIQWQKLRRYEGMVCRQADAVVAVSEADRAALAALAPDASLTTAPNGIETVDYPSYVGEPTAARTPFTILFTGKMDYRPNIDAALWFGQSVLPRIQAHEPSVRFLIVGLNPHRRLDVLRSNRAIEITGGVPDVRPYLQAATVCVIPMRVGGGTRLKALEAMVCGKPVVSTSLGIEGIPATDGQQLLLADTPDAFAAAVLTLIDDAKTGGGRARKLGECARHFVQTNYDWAQIIPIFGQVYQQVLARRP